MPGLSPGALRCSEGEEMRNQPRRWRRHSGKGGGTGEGVCVGGLRHPGGQGKKVFQGEEGDQLCLKLQLVPVI